MYIRKNEDTVFGFGQINEDRLIGNVGEFEYENNELIKKVSFPTFVDEESGLVAYMYNDKIVTFKELQREYLKDYYNVQ